MLGEDELVFLGKVEIFLSLFVGPQFREEHQRAIQHPTSAFWIASLAPATTINVDGFDDNRLIGANASANIEI